MNYNLNLIIALLLIAVAIYCIVIWFKKSAATARLKTLHDKTKTENVDWERNINILNKLKDRIGRAGFISMQERRTAYLIIILIFTIFLTLAFFLGIQRGTSAAVFIYCAFAIYFALISTVIFLHNRTNNFKREILFNTPIILENLILLVSSGRGILPALEKITAEHGNKNNKTIALFRLVYQLTASGINFSEALEKVADATDIQVLRHVLIYLDISNSEGGEIIPALQSLSEHTHTEWKISVEGRIKILENLVVFPVFFAVIGLMLIVAAVPILPVLNINADIKQLDVTSFTQNR